MKIKDIIVEKIVVGDISNNDIYYCFISYSHKDKIIVVPKNEYKNMQSELYKTYHVTTPDFIIDDDLKKITAYDKKHNTRMKTFNTGKMVVYPESNGNYYFSEIPKILKSLIKVKPQIYNYDLISDDYTGSVSKLVSSKSTKEQVLSNVSSLTAYHGTSSLLYEKIKKEGLIPNKRNLQYVDLVKNYSEYNIYLTNNLPTARKYAARQAGTDKSNGVVLEVTIRDTLKIVPDEDELNGWLSYSKYYSQILSIIKKIVPSIDKDEKFNIHFQNAFSEKNPYYETFITNEQWNQIQPILKKAFFMTYPLKTTFAYKGIIKPSDIKVIETFKPYSIKKDPTDAEWKTAYDKTLQTHKKVY